MTQAHPKQAMPDEAGFEGLEDRPRADRAPGSTNGRSATAEAPRSQTAADQLPLAPKGVRWLCLGASALLGLSAAAGIVASLVANPTEWFLIGFESLILFSAVYGVLLGRGWYREGAALAMFTVAGSILGASILGFLSAGRDISLLGETYQLRPLVGLRVLLGLVIVLCAALAVLLRRPKKSFPLLARSLVAGVLLVGLLGAGYAFGGSLLAGGGLVLLIGIVVAFLLCTGLLAACIHWGIAAFATGDRDRLQATD